MNFAGKSIAGVLTVARSKGQCTWQLMNIGVSRIFIVKKGERLMSINKKRC
jgi:hypothetical protein